MSCNYIKRVRKSQEKSKVEKEMRCIAMRSFSDVLVKWQGGFPLPRGEKIVKFLTDKQMKILQEKLQDVFGKSKSETVAVTTTHYKVSFLKKKEGYLVTVYREK
jgi:hypothetical protein